MARQALLRVLPLRNYFLLPENYASCKSVLVQRFGELLRKACNPRNFKGQVSHVLHAQQDRERLQIESSYILTMTCWIPHTA